MGPSLSWQSLSQHYVVLPQPTITHHLSALSTSLAPQIQTLIQKAEALVETQSTQVRNLEQRLEMIESAMLPVSSRSTTAASSGDDALESAQGGISEGGEGDNNDKVAAPRGLDSLAMKDMNPTQRRKVIMLKSKRKRLEEEQARMDRVIGEAVEVA